MRIRCALPLRSAGAALFAGSFKCRGTLRGGVALQVRPPSSRLRLDQLLLAPEVRRSSPSSSLSFKGSYPPAVCRPFDSATVALVSSAAAHHRRSGPQDSPQPALVGCSLCQPTGCRLGEVCSARMHVTAALLRSCTAAASPQYEIDSDDERIVIRTTAALGSAARAGDVCLAPHP